MAPFRGLDRAAIRDVLDQATSRLYPEGAALFQAGLQADRFFLLLDGFVRVVRTMPTGEQVVSLHLGPGELIGIAQATGRTHYPATAVAATETLALSWPSALWDGFVARHPGFGAAVAGMIGRRIEQLHDHVAELATKAAEQRVAAALLRLAGQAGRPVEGGVEIALPVTRANIADMTGTTLHTVSRLLAAWERDGIVASRRRRIVVTAPHRLVVLSGAA